jgi:reactive intermediate/imine deaminase
MCRAAASKARSACSGGSLLVFDLSMTHSTDKKDSFAVCRAIAIIAAITHRSRRLTMRLERIATQPDPYAPFRLAQGYRVGDLLFISGQAAYGEDGRIIAPGDFDAQASLAFGNLERALRAGGSSLRNVIKVTLFLTDMSNFDKVVELRGKYFHPPYPADTIVEISALYSKDAMIEIEAIALADDAAARACD